MKTRRVERVRLSFAEEHIAKRETERGRGKAGRPMEDLSKMSRWVSLFSGVSRLNDCDSNLGKTTFVARDRQIDSGPRPVSENSHSLQRTMEENGKTDRAPAQRHQLTAARFVCHG